MKTYSKDAISIFKNAELVIHDQLGLCTKNYNRLFKVDGFTEDEDEIYPYQETPYGITTWYKITSENQTEEQEKVETENGIDLDAMADGCMANSISYSLMLLFIFLMALYLKS